MSYDSLTRQLDLDDRPDFKITDAATMRHAVAMLHHRVSWNSLGGALNRVLAGTADRTVVNCLLRMSPGGGGAVVIDFTTALNRVLARQPLTAAQVTAIETVEQLVFTLPCNLFLGLNARADDPANGIDFLPGDVNADGTLPRANGAPTPLGAMEQAREQLENRLNRLPAAGGVGDLGTVCTSVVNCWQALTPVRPAVPAAPGVPPVPAIPAVPPLAQATGFHAAAWAPGAAPFAAPAYRNFPGPLTAAQSLALNATVMSRVNAL